MSISTEKQRSSTKQNRPFASSPNYLALAEEMLKKVRIRQQEWSNFITSSGLSLKQMEEQLPNIKQQFPEEWEELEKAREQLEYLLPQPESRSKKRKSFKNKRESGRRRLWLPVR